MSIQLKRARDHNIKELLKWKNDPVMRQFSIETQKEIEMEDHIKWFRRNKQNIYIIYDDIDYGDVRFDGDEVAIKVDPRFRGMGIGKKALELAKEMRDMMIAKIVDGNVASMRLFLSVGFKIIDHETENEIGYYILKYEVHK